jgi:hypothetical protein
VRIERVPDFVPWRAGGLEPTDREAALDELRAVAERRFDREHDAVRRALRDAVQADPQPGGEFDREHPDPGMPERRFGRVAGWWIGCEDQPTVVQGAGKATSPTSGEAHTRPSLSAPAITTND